MTPDPLHAALRADRWHSLALAAMSGVLNLLMLTGPLYMMNVYDRVLSSGSIPTLVALSLIAGLMIGLAGLCDILRARVQHRLAARLQHRLEPQVFAADLARGMGQSGIWQSGIGQNDTGQTGAGQSGAGQLRADLDAILRYRLQPAFLARHDLPFAAIFLGLLWLFHPSLGLIALITAGLLIAMACLGRQLNEAPHHTALAAAQRAEGTAQQMAHAAETLRGLGMRANASRLWQAQRAEALAAMVRSGDVTTGFSGAMRAIRMLVQSAMLGWGAALVLAQSMGGGAMIVSAILLGRALAPIEVITAQWPQIRQAQISHKALAANLAAQRPDPLALLPPPQGHLRLRHLRLATAAGRTILQDISCDLSPGQMLQIIGPSGAGKSALIRVIANLLAPTEGDISLDGAPLRHYPPDTLGRAIGYLPQETRFFSGTLLHNIARLDPAPDPQMVLRAARGAGLHEWILALPQGYDTPLDPMGGGLSGGQLQRLALARALYGDPCLLLLDEAHAHLDEQGRAALHHAIAAARARGAAVIQTAHNFADIGQADLIMCLSQGRVQLYGPREQVVAQVMQAAATLQERHA